MLGSSYSGGADSGGGTSQTAEAQAITAGGLDNQTLGKIAISHQNCDVSKQGQLVVGG